MFAVPVALLAISLLVFYQPLAELARLALIDERYTHTIAIPFLSLAVIWYHRAAIFPAGARATSTLAGVRLLGSILAAFASALAFYFHYAIGSLTLAILAVTLTWTGLFLAFFGRASAHAAAFPLGLLLLFPPLPTPAVETVQSFLQYGSAEATAWLFRLSGTTVFRDATGLQFTVPGVIIEVARECSGIRSTNALLIVTLLLAHFTLRSPWRQLIFVLFTVPFAIAKNAIRIASLTWLALYIDRDFLTGQLHHSGGLVFAGLSLGLLVPILLVLERGERGHSKA